MIDRLGFVDWATRRDGPANKVYAQANAREGMVLHSMEGWLAGSLAELDKPERSASWTFSLGLDGRLYQHYPVTASTWASGNIVANTKYNALELEGLYTMPINDAQITTLLRLCGDLGYTPAELYEHREVWNLVTPNAGPTACPSERYAPFYTALAELEEEDMTPQEAQQIASAIFDSNFSSYFMRAMKQYFTDTGEGDFSNAPDPDVMTALRAAIGSTAPRVTTIYSDTATALEQAGKAMRHAGQVAGEGK